MDRTAARAAQKWPGGRPDDTQQPRTRELASGPDGSWQEQAGAWRAGPRWSASPLPTGVVVRSRRGWKGPFVVGGAATPTRKGKGRLPMG